METEAETGTDNIRREQGKVTERKDRGGERRVEKTEMNDLNGIFWGNRILGVKKRKVKQAQCKGMRNCWKYEDGGELTGSDLRELWATFTNIPTWVEWKGDC